jgi:CheY-like chemotaxis protein
VSAEQVRGGSETILLVEDEDAVRQASQRAVEQHGYTVLAAADGHEALELYRARPAAIDLVISDMVMPGMSGAQLYEALRAEGHMPPFVLASGYRAPDVRERRGLDPDVLVVQKPWTLAELLVCIRRALDEHLQAT